MPPNSGATVGIQNTARNDGLTVAFNTGYVHAGLAVRFWTSPRWLSVSPTSGTLPPGGSTTLEVVFDATDLADGDHAGNLALFSNDPDEPRLEVPCRFHVGVAPAAFALDPNSLMLDTMATAITIKNLQTFWK